MRRVVVTATWEPMGSHRFPCRCHYYSSDLCVSFFTFSIHFDKHVTCTVRTQRLHSQ